MEVNLINLNEEKAKEIFSQSYELFKGVINKKDGIESYDKEFDWNTVEEVHENHMNNEPDCCDYYFIYNGVKYTLDISHNIEDFGYNSYYFRDNYPDCYKNLYCCIMYSYRNSFDFDDVESEVHFIYDKKNKRIVEILEIARHGLNIDKKKYVRRVQDDKVFEKIAKNFN